MRSYSRKLKPPGTKEPPPDTPKGKRFCASRYGHSLPRWKKLTAELQASEVTALNDAVQQIHRTRTWARLLQTAIIVALLGLGVMLWLIVRGLVSRLKDVSASVSEGSEAVAAAAGQISSSSKTLAGTASRAAASLQQTSASLETITSISRRNLENSTTADNLMSRVDQAMTEADGSFDLMLASMQNINASSEKIARIIKVIDEIAFQTNILALNAAVEAARAGKSGAGFAVVADEVRNLAQRSAQAAKDTAELIEESIQHSHEGRTRFEVIATVTRQVTESTASAKALIAQVKAGSAEQTRGVEQIASSIHKLRQAIESTAASAAEGANSNRELTSQSQGLEQSVRRLQDILGNNLGDSIRL